MGAGELVEVEGGEAGVVQFGVAEAGARRMDRRCDGKIEREGKAEEQR